MRGETGQAWEELSTARDSGTGRQDRAVPAGAAAGAGGDTEAARLGLIRLENSAEERHWPIEKTGLWAVANQVGRDVTFILSRDG